ncbi:MutS-related protein [Lacticaseibacillus daqingensis]|uniref:MutS-related protein n=1 Tax=Lacticaseibacillus daqingensis TaxID=2486014 RepID=UPI000F767747|nr:DNA mismatch repair protein MutS [Lacticaseibacillus daqingensis]
MTGNNWLWLGLFLAAIVGMVVVTGWRTRQRLRRRLLASWGEFPEARRQDSEASLKAAWQAAAQLRPTASQVDDLTWHDLNLMAVFKHLNQTESSVGAEALYAALRGFDFDRPNVSAKLVAFFTEQDAVRLQVRTAFAHLGKSDDNQSRRYLLDTAHYRLSGTWRYTVLGWLPLAAIVLIVLAPLAGVLLLIGSLVTNVVVYQQHRERLAVELNALRYLVQTIATAQRLARLATPQQAALKRALVKLAPITRHAFVFRTKTGSETEIIADYLGVMLMLPFRAYNKVLTTLSAHHEDALALWQALGELEVAIAVANYQLAAPVVCHPQRQATGITAAGVVHPLLKQPVANVIDWGQSALITGSNASGKSTYVKSVAINAVLAQTLGVATAESFALAPGHVITAMAIQDDLASGDSYFIAEIKAIQRVLTLAAGGAPVYGFIDEILKGTNTVERIAASAGVVQWLTATQALVMVATHDSELTGLLGAAVVNWHFQETVSATGVAFDYLLHQGPATSHNAIALLATLNYPATIIEQARNLAETFERTHAWPRG